MNRLANETSPYLLQHKENPVDWWPWGEAALARARSENKPILLSVGYAACHWCHVMAHESFEDPATAEVMNELFVNIKVDREERPDVDFIYMSALHALGEQGGWPLTMFLTPDGEPFWGGTYFPKESRFGRPSFVTVLREIARLVAQEPARVEHNRRAIATALAAEADTGPVFGEEALGQLSEKLARLVDPVNGGLPGAPKFPNPPLIELLWRHAARTAREDDRRAFALTLERMARGGIHDHLGGGFARYAVDERWLVPHFEKMLYDNAQLLELYALAARDNGDPLYERAAEGIVAWLAREMTLPGGGFAASLDADSEGEEGRFYVWSAEEIDTILGPEAPFFARHYDVSPSGNWEGKVILNRLAGVPATPEEEERLDALRDRLLAQRAGRVPPGKDDKILADWNGLMIAALARAALLLHRPQWLAPAEGAYRFIAESMRRDGRFGHSWRDGRLLFPGMASDHTALVRAALALYEATGKNGYRDDAQAWTELVERHYLTDDGILAMSDSEADDIILRPKPTHDDAVPNANGMHAENLLRLAALTGEPADQLRADRFLDQLLTHAARAPLAHATALNALDFRLSGAAIAVVGAGADDLLAVARDVPYPNRTVVDLSGSDAASYPGIAAGVSPAAGRSAAFVCSGGTCSLPVTDPNRLEETLQGLRGNKKGRV
ncbi:MULTISPECIES: thioredoxin domain-containing protein [unclassified Chelatococcus]|uniref:thioredoxin domain-containing protein n=1 Tax=unclassified Chelatococcus TaxID=2638111 RepID=UPI0002F2EF0A|nr:MULTISPECIES: thioredoxin domain-containing protein [unclassified Chelatococcus]